MKPVQQEELLGNIYRVLSHRVVGTDIAESIRIDLIATEFNPLRAGNNPRRIGELDVRKILRDLAN